MKFSPTVSSILTNARARSAALGQCRVESADILLELLNERNSTSVQALKRLGVDIEELSRNLRRGVSTMRRERWLGGDSGYTDVVQESLVLAGEELGSHFPSDTIRDEHILMGLISVPDSLTCEALGDYGVTPSILRWELQSIIMPAA